MTLSAEDGHELLPDEPTATDDDDLHGSLLIHLVPWMTPSPCSTSAADVLICSRKGSNTIRYQCLFDSGTATCLASRRCSTTATRRVFTLPGFFDTRCRHPAGS